MWLGVKLSRDKVVWRAGDGEWAERLIGKGREGWSVNEHRWVSNWYGHSVRAWHEGRSGGLITLACTYM